METKITKKREGAQIDRGKNYKRETEERECKRERQSLNKKIKREKKQ